MRAAAPAARMMNDADLYLRVREQEGRLYSDEAVARLPEVDRSHPLSGEWQARSRSAARLCRYLAGLPGPLTLLDLGCGNGWLSHRLAGLPGCRVLGVDLNHFELAQAARVFGRQGSLSFVRADVFRAPLRPQSINVVVIASAVQYFADLTGLVRHLLGLLCPRGELHILDSPLYGASERLTAEARSRAYYTAIGFPRMADRYHHHLNAALDTFRPVWLYSPDNLWARLRRRLGEVDSPFPWIRIRQ